MALRDTTKIKGTNHGKVQVPPEMQLWASMMELAISDYINGAISGSFTDDYRSAKEWIFGAEQVALNSFNSICLVFNLDPDLTRKALREDPINIKLRLTGKAKKREQHV